MSTPRRPAAAARIALGLAAVAVLATGCSVASPTPINTPYAAGDGVNRDLTVPQVGTVKFRNFLMVSAAKGAPGVLVGAVATETASPVDVQLTVLGTDNRPIGQTMLTVKPGELAQVGPDATALQVSDMPLPPGSVVTLHAQTAGGGTDFQLPVLAPVDQYSSITPTASVSTTTRSPSSSSASPTASGTVSPTASGTVSPSGSGTATAQATGSPTATG